MKKKARRPRRGEASAGAQKSNFSSLRPPTPSAGQLLPRVRTLPGLSCCRIRTRTVHSDRADLRFTPRSSRAHLKPTLAFCPSASSRDRCHKSFSCCRLALLLLLLAATCASELKHTQKKCLALPALVTPATMENPSVLGRDSTARSLVVGDFALSLKLALQRCRLLCSYSFARADTSDAVRLPSCSRSVGVSQSLRTPPRQIDPGACNHRPSSSSEQQSRA